MTPSARFDIVVGVDLGELSDVVLEHAFEEALARERPALHVVTVVQDEAAEAAARQPLVELVRAALDEGVPAERRAAWTVLLHVRRGRPDEELVDLAGEIGARLIVVGRFGLHRRSRWRIGSTADRVVTHADCPVLVVTPPRDVTHEVALCAACVEVRQTSGGEQWLCARHHGDRV